MPFVRLRTVRRTASLPDGALCVDDVAGLGTFLEVERIIGDDVPGAAVQAELAAFVAALGIGAIRTEESYDSLLRAGGHQLCIDPSVRRLTGSDAGAYG